MHADHLMRKQRPLSCMPPLIDCAFSAFSPHQHNHHQSDLFINTLVHWPCNTSYDVVERIHPAAQLPEHSTKSVLLVIAWARTGRRFSVMLQATTILRLSCSLGHVGRIIKRLQAAQPLDRCRIQGRQDKGDEAHPLFHLKFDRVDTPQSHTYTYLLTQDDHEHVRSAPIYCGLDLRDPH